MSDDWKEFLKEVHADNKKSIEWSKEREQKEYGGCNGDYCEIRRK